MFALAQCYTNVCPRHKQAMRCLLLCLRKPVIPVILDLQGFFKLAFY